MNKIKSTLISAYACDPFKGSEPGIGWNWAIELGRLDYNVFVITRGINKEVIDKGLANMEPIPNIHFCYYDLPKWLRFIEKMPFGVYSYYFFWQIGIVSIAKDLIKTNNIDILHHLTWGVFRQPSFLYKLNKPFIFGPIGGAEMTPNRILKSLPVKDYIKEYIRVTANYVLRLSPILNRMYKNSTVIFSRTEETAEFLPSKYNHKKQVQVDIGIRKINHYNEKPTNQKLKVLYVGRFMGWKGIHLSIDSINKINKDQDDVEFTVIGSGPFEKELKNRAKSASIKFIDWVPQSELYTYYESHDCFLFPSFHDSGGTVILEAFSYGLPVICLNIGGPNKYVDDDCGFRVKVENKSVPEIIDELSHIVLDLNENRDKLEDLRNEAFKKAEYYNWSRIVKTAYNFIETKL
ncbi:glycosyltransferase family 4 protein [Hyunsoonleella aestuarii]|uniref:Glycosyl transferase family 1 domain-containing protein n=1 Tax=Hyunsoonleella aestuarii TaxID=912802 RepID=A0ABP8E9J4_9FLAO|nr:glycosyltransferase [Hyunsoonleella aestuarii]